MFNFTARSPRSLGFLARAAARVGGVFVSAAMFALLSGCGNSPGAKIDYAYVSSPEAVLRDRVAAVYNKTGVVHNGERVQVLERMPTRRFLRVRSPRGEEGWVQERYLADQQTYDEFQHLAEKYKNTPPQAVALTRAQVNLHVTPGRKTEHLYQLNENERLDLLERQTADRNASAPAPQQKAEKKDAESESAGAEDQRAEKPGPAPVLEDWWLVRDAKKRVGWVLGRILDVDIPVDVAQYAEGQRIVAFFVLDQARDEEKSVPEYLVLLTQNKEGASYDYNQARVFTWNVRRHRYETAFRERDIFGVLPATLGTENFGKEGNLRTFTLQVRDQAGAPQEAKYKFNPPIVRLVPGQQPPPKMHANSRKSSHSR
jgi:SH3-like domain-containing protein